MRLFKRLYAMRMVKSSRIPDEYQEVEWVGSTKYVVGDDTEIITTGVKIGPDGIKDVIIDCELSFDMDTMMFHSTTYKVQYGVGGTRDFTQCAFGLDYKGTLRFYSSANIEYYPWHFEKLHILLDNVNKIYSVSGFYEPVVGTCDIHNMSGSHAGTLSYELFGYSTDTNPTLHPCPSRVYSFKMYDGNTLLRDYVPCYRKLDGKIGLYDLCESICDVTQTPFYTTSEGVFEKGRIYDLQIYF